MCPPDAVPAVAVEVRDSVSGAPIASGTRGVVQDGQYVDSLKPFGYLDDGTTLVSLSAADERPGTYAVTVERQRYKQWRLAGVVVAAGSCHVETVNLVALLQPLINPP